LAIPGLPEPRFNQQADITGTGSRIKVLQLNFLKFFLLARALQVVSDPYCQSTCLCLSVCMSVSANLMLNISETKRFSGSCPTESLWKCIRRVDWWRHRRHNVTLCRHNRDVAIFKVIAFGN